MDFAIPPATAALLDRARAFMRTHVLPVEPTVLARGVADCDDIVAGLRAAARAEGLWLPQMAKEEGGLGLSLLDHGLLSEVLGGSPLGHLACNCQAPDAGNMEILHRYASPAQRERWLEPLLRGDIRSCFAMTEPDTAGSNPTLLRCAARLDGDDYVLDGRKWFTTGADGAAFAVVMAVTDPAAEAHRRASMLIVPTDTPGFRRVRNVPIFGHAGAGWDSHAELEFTACRVPRDSLLGPAHGGFVIAQERLGPGRIHHCMRWLGICERALGLMAARAVARELAPGEHLGDKQIVQAWLAECRARIDAARLLVLRTAWLIDQHGFAAARDDISLIKFHVAEVLSEVLDRAIQVHGALGLTDDTVLAFFYTRERGARIYDGPDEVHKVAAARRILARHRPGRAG
ncbi:acyl-CoA dehydrogenase family protein [Nannocystis bainbridge]|uniref:Acyl-CoA dehydrogenase family protein n=1 Tax=Nannocystis bainbridge TaxID=2995303 RepID=A0ABT5E1C9_9BACT|nr:acyl-CoA dehydrogenase family protein [Nannocystis bainbridge]MDC0719681.1 acyl-CoA dehydrogenase family protein [Nannocystis bainbridge]